MTEELHDQCCDEMCCPFCGETDFDATGLKIHLLAGHCDEFKAVSTDVPRTRTKANNRFDTSAHRDGGTNV